MVWNLPNIFTLFRFALVGVFVALFAAGHILWALFVFLLAGLTDLVDGYIARKHDMITDWGKAMDPIADKCLQVAVWVCLLVAGYVESWLLIIVMVKEGILILGGVLGYKKLKLVQASKGFGKFAAAFMFGALVISFFHEQVAPYDFYIRLVAVGFNVLALVNYAVPFLRTWRKDGLTKDESPL